MPPWRQHLTLPAMALVVVVIVAGWSLATHVERLPTERFSAFESQVVEADLKVEQATTHVRGPHEVEVAVVVHNPDVVAHAGNLTVQLLDKDGKVIAEGGRDTGEVPPGERVSLSVTAQRENLVEDHISSLFLVRQRS